MNKLGGLLGEVAAFQRDVLARRSVVARVRAGGRPIPLSFATRLVRRTRTIVPVFAALGALAVWWGLRPAPLSFAVGDGAGTVDRPGRAGERFEAPVDRDLPLHFSDGSSVTLDRGARAQVTTLEGRGASIQLERGRAEVSVHHRPHTRWHLRAGSFDVTVTGTRFSIDWENNAQALTVMMTEGTVEVRGYHLPGGSPIVVTAGQRFHASAREPHWTLVPTALGSSIEPIASPSPNRAAASPLADGPGIQASPTAAPSPPSESPPTTAAATGPAMQTSGARSGSSAARSWQALGSSGHYQEALAVAERAGFAKACRTLGAAGVVQLGDVARLAQNVARAEEAYHAARRRFPKTDRAAFGLGLIAFDQRRDYRMAARWFDTYVREYPRGPLAREATGRAMESWHRAGDRELAARAARDYLRQAPSGPYAPLARQIAAP